MALDKALNPSTLSIMSTQSKVTLSDVQAALNAAHATPALIRETLEALNLKLAKEESGKAEKPPKLKTQFIGYIADPEGKLKGHAFTGWLVQVEESAAPTTVIDRVKNAARSFNDSAKGRKRPVKNVAETFESVPRKHWQVDDETTKTIPKTKSPIYLFTTDGSIS